MKISLMVLVCTMGIAGIASAQGADMGYIEGVAQSAFGNVTSQSFGGELGVTVRSGLQVYVDAGYVRDTTPSSLAASAQVIANDISAKAGGGAYQVKQPVTFGVAGIRYLLPVDQSRFAPYVMVGGGAARVEKNVSFTVASGQVSDYVTVGSDLAGTETKGMISVIMARIVNMVVYPQ